MKLVILLVVLATISVGEAAAFSHVTTVDPHPDPAEQPKPVPPPAPAPEPAPPVPGNGTGGFPFGDLFGGNMLLLLFFLFSLPIMYMIMRSIRDDWY